MGAIALFAAALLPEGMRITQRGQRAIPPILGDFKFSLTKRCFLSANGFTHRLGSLLTSTIRRVHSL